MGTAAKIMRTSLLMALVARIGFAQASLPTAYTGPWERGVPPEGWAFHGLGGPDYNPDYDGINDGAAKLDGTGDSISIHFEGASDSVTYWMKGQTFSGGTFQVEQSSDGTNWTALATYTELPTNATFRTNYPAVASRHIRFIYTEKDIGNVGVDGISVTALGMPVFLTSNPLPNGVVGQPFSLQIEASNFPTNFSVMAGALPAGLGLTPTGMVTGTPQQVESANFTILAANWTGATNATYDLQIDGPPVFTTTSLPDGGVGVAYSNQIVAAGATAFSKVAGNLPSGLGLTTSGWVTGTPAVVWSSNFTVRATNDFGWSNRLFNLSIQIWAGAVLNRNVVNVRENGEGRLFVKLDQAPAANTTVTVARVSGGDEDLAVQAGAQLVFTKANWNTWQRVTLAAADDADAANGTATFHVAAPGGGADVAATELDDDIGENLALAANGSTISGTKAFRPGQLIDGIHNVSTNYGYTTWTNDPPGTMTLDLKGLATVSRIRLLNWDWSYRVHRYRIESSEDGTNWSTLVDASAEDHQGWEDWVVAGQSIRYLRFTGLSNTANQYVCIAEWEVYGTSPEPQPPWFTDQPQWTDGQLRLAWTNPNARGHVQVWQSTNLAPAPPPWTNLGVQTSPWTSSAPAGAAYYRLIWVP